MGKSAQQVQPSKAVLTAKKYSFLTTEPWHAGCAWLIWKASSRLTGFVTPAFFLVAGTGYLISLRSKSSFFSVGVACLAGTPFSLSSLITFLAWKVWLPALIVISYSIANLTFVIAMLHLELSSLTSHLHFSFGKKVFFSKVAWMEDAPWSTQHHVVILCVEVLEISSWKPTGFSLMIRTCL